MCSLMQKLGAQRHSGINSDVASHSGYAPINNPTIDDHAFPSEEDMPWHGADHVIDSPDRVATLDFELQPSVPIHVLSDGEEQDEANVMSLSVFIILPTNMSMQRRRVQTKQSAIRIDLKEAAAFVFGGDLDASEKLVAMHDTSLTGGNLGCFEGDGRIGNGVHMTSYPSICISLSLKIKILF
ncbi:hypothetical protein AAG906_016074 [Vitis piasezkii]